MRQEALLANFGGNRNSLMRSSREELNMVMMRRKRRRMVLMLIRSLEYPPYMV